VHAIISASIFILVGGLAHLLNTRSTYNSKGSNNKIYLIIFILFIFNTNSPISLAFINELQIYTRINTEPTLLYLFIPISLTTIFFNLLLLSINLQTKIIILIRKENLILLLRRTNIIVLLA
jgi:hypothetical protein